RYVLYHPFLFREVVWPPTRPTLFPYTTLFRSSITFMLGRDLSSALFPESGFTGAWHGTSHHGDKPENVANYAKVNRYHVQNLARSEEHTSELQSRFDLVCRLLLEKKKSPTPTVYRSPTSTVRACGSRRRRRDLHFRLSVQARVAACFCPSSSTRRYSQRASLACQG